MRLDLRYCALVAGAMLNFASLIHAYPQAHDQVMPASQALAAALGVTSQQSSLKQGPVTTLLRPDDWALHSASEGGLVVREASPQVMIHNHHPDCGFATNPRQTDSCNASECNTGCELISRQSKVCDMRDSIQNLWSGCSRCMCVYIGVEAGPKRGRSRPLTRGGRSSGVKKPKKS